MKRSHFASALVAGLFITTLAFPGSWGCGGSSSGGGGGGGGDDGGGGGGGGVSANSLAVAYPDDLAVTSLTAYSVSQTGLTLLKAQEGEPGELLPPPFEERREEMGNILAAEAPADMQFEVAFDKSGMAIDCYGPSLWLNASGGTGHPDGQMQINPPGGSQGLPGNDLGIWNETEGNQACAAAKVSELISQIENYLRIGLEGTAAALAAANVAGMELPAQGETTTMTEEVNSNFDEAGIPIEMTSAAIERAAEDTSEGFPVFTTSFTGTVEEEAAPALKSQEGGEPEPSSMPSSVEVVLEHIPEVSLPAGATEIPEDSTYCGRLQEKVSFDEAESEGNLAGCDGMTECLSIEYCKESETSLTYHLRRMVACGKEATCFDADGNVDHLDIRIDDFDPDGGARDFYYIVCGQNPEDGTGSCAYGWQAGRGPGGSGENVRVFQAVVNPDGTGRAYAGYSAGNISQAHPGPVTIGGFICNWAGPGSEMIGVKTTTLQPLAQKQEFERNAEGIYVPTSSNITYAPTNSCNKAANSFAYGIQNLPTDVPASEAVTNDLIALDEIDFAIPDPPVVPVTE